MVCYELFKKFQQMKKSILNIGKALDKTEQKQINGGFGFSNCFDIPDQNSCDYTLGCNWYGCYCGPTYPHTAPCGG